MSKSQTNQNLAKTAVNHLALQNLLKSTVPADPSSRPRDNAATSQAAFLDIACSSSSKQESVLAIAARGLRAPLSRRS